MRWCYQANASSRNGGNSRGSGRDAHSKKTFGSSPWYSGAESDGHFVHRILGKENCHGAPCESQANRLEIKSKPLP